MKENSAINKYNHVFSEKVITRQEIRIKMCICTMISIMFKSIENTRSKHAKMFTVGASGECSYIFSVILYSHLFSKECTNEHEFIL